MILLHCSVPLSGPHIFVLHELQRASAVVLLWQANTMTNTMSHGQPHSLLHMPPLVIRRNHVGGELSSMQRHTHCREL